MEVLIGGSVDGLEVGMAGLRMEFIGLIILRFEWKVACIGFGVELLGNFLED